MMNQNTSVNVLIFASHDVTTHGAPLRGMTEGFSKNLFNASVVRQCSLASYSQLKKGVIFRQVSEYSS